MVQRPRFATLEYKWVCVDGLSIQHTGSYDFNLQILLTYNATVLNDPYIQITLYSHEMQEKNISLFIFSK